MRSRMPYPCSGPSEAALRTSISSVPCGSSTGFVKGLSPIRERRVRALSFLVKEIASPGDCTFGRFSLIRSRGLGHFMSVVEDADYTQNPRNRPASWQVIGNPEAGAVTYACPSGNGGAPLLGLMAKGGMLRMEEAVLLRRPRLASAGNEARAYRERTTPRARPPWLAPSGRTRAGFGW